MSWDWPPEILAAAKHAARDAHKRYGWLLSQEDAEQEALLILASHAEAVRKRMHKPRYVERMVGDYLRRHGDRLERDHDKDMSYEEWAEPHWEEA